MIKINKKYGILFWITGLSGSGKTTLAKKIYKKINKIYGPTIILSGDDIRNIFSLKGYSYKERSKVVLSYCKLAQLLTKQKINVIFAVIGMMNHIRKWNKKNIPNYLEVYIKADVSKIIKQKKKKIYLNNQSNIVGIDIKPEIPKNPHIIINNNFKKNIDILEKELITKINETLN